MVMLSLLRVGDSEAIACPQSLRRGSLLLAQWTEDGVRRSLAVVTTAHGAIVNEPPTPAMHRTHVTTPLGR